MKSRLFYTALFGLLIAAIIYLFPWLFTQVALWQREFNQLISGYLHDIKQQPAYAGSWLILVSFLYGVFHALGPGHGKFIIAGYLSTHQTQLSRSMQITFFSSLMQGVVAISAVSIIVLVLQLSSGYFNLSQLWLERTAFCLVILLGLNWCWKNGKILYKKRHQQKKRPQIQRIQEIPLGEMRVGSLIAGKSAVHISNVFPDHNEHCGCGHQHMPDPTKLKQNHTFKDSLLIILSIGMRPCSGAIFVLFLAYMLDLYRWGVFATLAMAFGTGITLSAFALLVRYARATAVKMGQWYRVPFANLNIEAVMKCVAGVMLIFFALSLLYSSTLPVSGGAVLFAR